MTRHRFDIYRDIAALVGQAEAPTFDAAIIFGLVGAEIEKEFGAFAAGELLRQFAAEFDRRGFEG